MNLILLAAGKGSRIFKKINKNKQLIKIKNKTLLNILIENGIKSKFKKIIIVIGFQPKKIIDSTMKYKNIIFVKNHFYEKREMLHSIICGLKKSNSDTIISYSDIIYNNHLLNLIKKKSRREITIPVKLNWKLVWKKRNKNYFDDAETLKYNNNLNLLEIGNKIDRKNIPKAQFMGLIYVPQKKIKKIISEYKKNINLKIQTTQFINYLIKKKIIIKVLPTKSFWYEFDDYEDLRTFDKKF